MKATFRDVSRGAIAMTAAGAIATLGADCDGDVVQDPTFRDWCGDKLCAWTLDSGNIQRVPTWSADDLGVSFVAMGTQISQVTTEHDATCLLFTTTADIDPAAQMTLLVDFDNDGTNDFQQLLGATDWHKVETEIATPRGYDGITFHLLKAGTGTAVLAEMRIQSTTGCTEPHATVPLPLGEACFYPTDCAAGLFCDLAGAGVCAQCSDKVACAGAATCRTRSVFLPLQCGPGERLGQSGAPCIFDNDCASDACGGASLTSLIDASGPPDADFMTLCQAPAKDCALLDASQPCGCFLNHGGTCR
jgi:hypothetical protein